MRDTKVSLTKCPFCGGGATLLSKQLNISMGRDRLGRIVYQTDDRFWVQHWSDVCPISDGCMKTVDYATPEEAVSAWNQRGE